jgi:hypothetical protein
MACQNRQVFLAGKAEGERNMEKPARRPRSHLFTLSVWEEEIDAERTELRGKVQLLTNREVCYFRDWETLVPLLRRMLSNLDSDIDLSSQDLF